MYHNGRRTVDEYCMKILTPLGLLIWYLDDGSITYDKRGKSRGMDIRIHSNAYTEAENKMMMKYLNDRFGLRFNLYQNFKKKRMKRYFGLRLKAVDRLKFYDEIIAPNMEYIPPDMKYKIPNRETIVALIENPQNRKGSMEELREKYSLNSMETQRDERKRLVLVTKLGTNVSSYGGLSRSTYTGIQGNYTDVSGNLTLSVMGTMFNSCTHGNEMPDLIICPPAVWNYYESLLTPTVQTSVSAVDLKGYAQMTRTGIVAPGAGLKGQQGFNAIFYRGVPVVADEKAPSGDMYFLNTKHLTFYGLPSTLPGYKPFRFTSDNIEDVYDQAPKTFGWSFSGFQVPIDQYGQVGHIILIGNLISDSPRHLGRLTNITGAQP